MYVESRPASPDRVDEFNRWYDEVHVPEVLRLDGFLSAQRFKPVDGDGTFVAIYEIEGDDLGALFASLAAAAQTGVIKLSDAMSMDPPPIVRILELLP
jgi:hypothetical protein